MRIAVLSTLASGGAAIAAWRITRALSDFGHQCSFFVLTGANNPLQIPLMGNDTALRLPALFQRWNNLTTPESRAVHAVELFSDTLVALNFPFSLPEAIYEAEVIHLHWVVGMLFSPVLLQAINGKKIVWTLHDENPFTGGCHYTGGCRAFESQCRDCPLLKKAGAGDVSDRCFQLKKQLYPLINPSLVSPSVSLAEKTKTSSLLGNYPMSVIMHPLDIKNFQPPQNRMVLRKKLGLPEDAFIIMSGCENLDNPRKNTKVLFEVLSYLSDKSPDLPVVVMTYGYGQPPKITFPAYHFGYIENEVHMIELYGVADLFVHTAVQEVLGLTLCEAQACGTTTLCFNVGGCPETILPEKTGFLVAETNSQALAEKLSEIIASRDALADMRIAARAFAEERFNPHTIAAAYTAVFEKAQIAPGLELNTPLYAELMQNQIVSRDFFRDAGLGSLRNKAVLLPHKIRQHPLVKKTERYWYPLWRRVRPLLRTLVKKFFNVASLF